MDNKLKFAPLLTSIYITSHLNNLKYKYLVEDTQHIYIL